MTEQDKKSKKTEFYWGFPVGELEDEQTSARTEKESGVALIIAIMIISTIVIFTTDMIINSSVNLQLAVANRDNIKAEYVAKSGANLSLFLISADWGVDLFQYQMQNKKPSDSPQDIWAAINGLPIGAESMEMAMGMADKLNLSKVNDEGAINQMQLFDGTFVIDVQDEGSKINLNYCVESRAEECMSMIELLMSCPAERSFMEGKKITPKEIAANIKDWVDDNSRITDGSSYSGESDPYIDRTPKVRPKNAPFDSIEELKMVAGWDDDLQRIFAPYFTIYPIPKIGLQAKPKINLNSANRELIQCLMPESALRCAEKAAKFLVRAEKDDPPEVLGDDAGIQKRLSEIFCEDDKKKTNWFTYYTDVFRVVSTGIVGDQTVRLDTVVQRAMPDDIEKNEGFKGTYKYLYWKML
ncbi:MAG: general secretion pathway protein GspK [Oligoflexales bacterium]